MAQHIDAIRAAGGDVLAVCAAAPASLAQYLAASPALPFAIVTDPTRASFRALELGRTSWLTFFRPSVLLRYLRHIFRGWLPRKGSGEEGLLQLGGDFIFDEQGRMIYAYRSAEPTDRPAVKELIERLGR